MHLRSQMAQLWLKAYLSLRGASQTASDAWVKIKLPQ